MAQPIEHTDSIICNPSAMDSSQSHVCPSQKDSSDIENASTVPDTYKRPPTVVDRYFTKHYRIDLQKKEGEDICILTHSNKICIVTLAPTHPVLSDKKTVVNVDFNVGGANRLDNKMSGKSKRGALWLGALAPLCTLTCSDDSRYLLYCGVKGQLIEANGALIHSPHLLNQQPWSTGYVGIMLPALKGYDAEMARLLTEEQYQEAVKARLDRKQLT